MSLNSKQQEVVDKCKAGKNVFITGGAGVGKSFLIEYISKNKESLFPGKVVGITSTTGISALLINGTTIHSYLGLGLGNNTADSMYTFIVKRKHLRERWRNLGVLICDEISMLTADLFEKIDYISRKIRYKPLRPFGGLQLIFSGDFFQLPPIGVTNGNQRFCFQSDVWEKTFQKSQQIILKDIIRQEDTTFQNALNMIRMGIVDDYVKDIFESCKNLKQISNKDIKPTKLYPLNSCVDYINKSEFDKAAKSSEGNLVYEYVQEFESYNPREASRKVQESVIEKYKSSSIIPDTLELCVGCQVMLIQNLDLTSEGEQKLVNGSRGVVKRFVDDIPVVEFTNGKEILVDYYTWEIEENDISYGQIIQIPLKLAYAFSIHKSQGCSLDYVSINLRNVFEYGMGYVALSRVRDLSGLYIEDIDWNKIRAHPAVSEYFHE